MGAKKEPPSNDAYCDSLNDPSVSKAQELKATTFYREENRREKMDEEKKKAAGEEAEIVVANAEPIKTGNNEPPIPPGHSRFYCSNCHTVCPDVSSIPPLSAISF